MSNEFNEAAKSVEWAGILVSEFTQWAWNNNWLQKGENLWWNFATSPDKQVQITTIELYKIYKSCPIQTG